MVCAKTASEIRFNVLGVTAVCGIQNGNTPLCNSIFHTLISRFRKYLVILGVRLGGMLVAIMSDLE